MSWILKGMQIAKKKKKHGMNGLRLPDVSDIQFRLGLRPCKKREWLHVLSASGPSLLPTNPDSHSPRLAGSRELRHRFLSLDIIPHPWKNWFLPGWNLFPSYGLSSTQLLPTESCKQHALHVFGKHVFSESGSTAVTNLPLCLDAPPLTL